MDNESAFCKKLEPVSRILETDGWWIWGCSPIEAPDGKIHVFFSRWPVESGIPDSPMRGWLTHSEIAHAIADKPEGPYRIAGTVLKGRGGNYWDSVTIHNPTVHKVGDKYALFYMGNSTPEHIDKDLNNYVETKRVGLAMADSLDGPWIRIGDQPLINPASDPDAWDSCCTTNPSFIQHPNGQFWLYYKSWDFKSWREVHGNRKYGLAIADDIRGPYRKHPENPLVDYSKISAGENGQIEDAYVFMENGEFYMTMRDMGVFSQSGGLIVKSTDGIHWSTPQIAFRNADCYFKEPDVSLERAGQLERPQILMRDGHPAYLFVAMTGGKYNTSSAAVLKINHDLPGL